MDTSNSDFTKFDIDELPGHLSVIYKLSTVTYITYLS
jgi:hypothetical protein